MHKIFDNMLTNEWKTFSRGRKEGRDFKRKEEKKKEGMAYVKRVPR